MRGVVNRNRAGWYGGLIEGVLVGYVLIGYYQPCDTMK